MRCLFFLFSLASFLDLFYRTMDIKPDVFAPSLEMTEIPLRALKSSPCIKHHSKDDESMEELHSLLPNAQSYDKDFLKSNIHLPVLLYYLFMTVSLLIAYVSGEHSVILSLLTLIFFVLFGLPLILRHIFRGGLTHKDYTVPDFGTALRVG